MKRRDLAAFVDGCREMQRRVARSKLRLPLRIRNARRRVGSGSARRPTCFSRAHNGTCVAATVAVIISFLGTKGGTGTTTMALNCATAIQRLSRRQTLLMETKVGPGDLAVFLALRPRYSLIDLIDDNAWRDPVRAGHYLTLHESGVHVLPTTDAFGRPDVNDAEAVDHTVACFAASHEFVVVDAGSMLTSPAVTALAMSDVVTLVANPDVPCLRNVRRLSDALRVAGIVPERMRILLNRSSDHGVMPVAQIEKVLGRSIDFQVGSDYRTVAAALNAGAPIASVRPSELHQQLDAMARAFIGPGLAAAS